MKTLPFIVAAGLLTAIPAEAVSVASGPWWITFSESGTDYQRAPLGAIADAFTLQQDAALYLCSPATEPHTGKTQREIVRKGLADVGIRLDRVFVGGECDAALLGMALERAPANAVFVSMGPTAAVKRSADRSENR